MSLCFQVAFDKLFRFATSNIFGNEAAGRMCAEMCGTASRVDPVSVLKRFVPHITGRIAEILEGMPVNLRFLIVVNIHIKSNCHILYLEVLRKVTFASNLTVGVESLCSVALT